LPSDAQGAKFRARRTLITIAGLEIYWRQAASRDADSVIVCFLDYSLAVGTAQKILARLNKFN
jgi:hypothetical protein